MIASIKVSILGNTVMKWQRVPVIKLAMAWHICASNKCYLSMFRYKFESLLLGLDKLEQEGLNRMAVLLLSSFLLLVSIADKVSTMVTTVNKHNQITFVCLNVKDIMPMIPARVYLCCLTKR
jgi:hypothetical protein